MALVHGPLYHGDDDDDDDDDYYYYHYYYFLPSVGVPEGMEKLINNQ